MQQHIHSKASPAGVQVFFVVLVTGLLIASSNLGLINSAWAIKTRDGTNLIGARDFLLGAILFLGTLNVLAQRRTALGNRLCRISLLVALLSPVAAGVGLLLGGNALSVARELVTMLGWTLAFVLGSNLQSRMAIRSLNTAILVIGLLVALGVFVESFTLGQIRVVTAADVVEETRRSTPTGWPLMMVSASLAMASLLMDRKAAIWSIAARFTIWSVILVASLLTQSRTLVVGLLLGAVVLLGLALIGNRDAIKWPRLLLVGSVIPVVVAVAVLIGRSILRTDFAEYFKTRYLILSDISTLIEYSEEDTRRAEIELGLRRYRESPILGLGLGTQYREATLGSFERADPAVLIHNLFAYFLFRYGIPGLLLLLALILEVVKSLWRALKDRSDLSILGVGLATAMVNLLACGFFGNVFGTAYGVPLAMTTLGCLIAYEETRSGRQLSEPAGRQAWRPAIRPIGPGLAGRLMHDRKL